MSETADGAGVADFWRWFTSVASDLAVSEPSDALLDELDARVSRLGALAWEIGPGETRPNMLAISPDGDASLLPLTEAIVAAAPRLEDWEFLPARPRKDMREFMVRSCSGADLRIDPSAWRYVLYAFPDGVYDIVVWQPGFDASEEDRYTAAVLLLDGLLGEEVRLHFLAGIEAIATLSPEHRLRSTPMKHLYAHLTSRAAGRA